MGSVGALLLAAGLSQRMGALKALLPWQGTTLLAYQASTLQSVGLNPVLVVLGHRAEELKPHVPSVTGVRYLLNPDYLKGKTTSLKTGLSALDPRDTDAVLVLNVDQPRSPQTLETILREHRQFTDLITIPTYKGKGGHPIILSLELLDEIMGVSEEDQGLKGVVRRHGKNTRLVEMGSDEVLIDLNSEQDYQDALDRFGGV